MTLADLEKERKADSSLGLNGRHQEKSIIIVRLGSKKKSHKKVTVNHFHIGKVFRHGHEVTIKPYLEILLFLSLKYYFHISKELSVLLLYVLGVNWFQAVCYLVLQHNNCRNLPCPSDFILLWILFILNKKEAHKENGEL